MPRLILMRHAKSDWSQSGKHDVDRPLNARGRAAAPRMGEWCAAQGLVPQRIVCSAALRTRQTLACLLDHFDGEIDIRLSRRLYEAEAGGYYQAVQEGGDAETLMLIGHNPATHELAMLLAGRGPDQHMSRLHARFPTAAIAVIDIDAPRFADCVPGAGYLAMFMTPAELSEE